MNYYYSRNITWTELKEQNLIVPVIYGKINHWLSKTMTSKKWTTSIERMYGSVNCYVCVQIHLSVPIYSNLKVS